MSPQNNFLFNFAASHSGGGYKRLYEYARWFNEHGGASFIVHPRCADLVDTFPHNRFFIAAQSRLARLFSDCSYLRTIERTSGQPDLYYSYGIPMYFRFGAISWFHLSNVLPLGARGIPLAPHSRVTLAVLGRRIRRGFANADVISAESKASTDLIAGVHASRLFVSVNGSDDELAALRAGRGESKEALATVVGTIKYKALEDSVRVFEMLKRTHRGLKLAIIGNEAWVPKAVRSMPDVIIRGPLKRPDVIDCLRRSKFYITTSRVENSYNAASEGIFLADDSYISDIAAHRELLMNEPFELVSVPGITQPLLHVRRDDLNAVNLKSWDTVVVEMIERFRAALRH